MPTGRRTRCPAPASSRRLGAARQTVGPSGKAGNEQSPNHRHRNLKAFEEHIQTHVSVCFVTEQYSYEELVGVRG